MNPENAFHEFHRLPCQIFMGVLFLLVDFFLISLPVLHACRQAKGTGIRKVRKGTVAGNREVIGQSQSGSFMMPMNCRSLWSSALAETGMNLADTKLPPLLQVLPYESP